MKIPGLLPILLFGFLPVASLSCGGDSPSSVEPIEHPPPQPVWSLENQILNTEVLMGVTWFSDTQIYTVGEQGTVDENIEYSRWDPLSGNSLRRILVVRRRRSVGRGTAKCHRQVRAGRYNTIKLGTEGVSARNQS